MAMIPDRALPATDLSDDYIFGGFGRKKGGRLSGLLEREFLPELAGSRRRRSSIEDAFLGFLDPAAGEEYITRGAERIASDVLRPGGVVTEGIRAARGGEIAKGWGTAGSDLSRQEANIVADTLSSTVGSYLGQALPAMYEGAAGRALSAYGLTQEQVQELLNSLYTGLAGAESLGVAKQGQGLLNLGLGPL